MSRSPWNKLLVGGSSDPEWWLSKPGQVTQRGPEYSDGEEATDLLMVAKYFERIGDHATNIAEWVIYSLKTTEG